MRGQAAMGATPPVNTEAGEQSAACTTAPDPEREVVLALEKQNSRGALELCAQHYGASIGRLCMALVGSQTEAEDLVQETLLAAHDGFGEWRREGGLRSWLFGIARRKCARHLERRTRQSRKLELVPSAPESDSGEALAILRQRAEAARSALSEIRPTEREVLLLRYEAELSFKDVGSACGIDEATARKRVSRALQRLRSSLVREDHGS